VPELIYHRPAILDEIDPCRHAVIEASAGTGKTFIIEHLFADLVMLGRCDPEQVLVVTFTEKATGELRARVRGTLEAILRGEGGEPRPDHKAIKLDAEVSKRLYAALNSFERVPVFTIHGFCQRVLTEFAFLTGSSFALDVVEAPSAFHRAFRDTVRDTLAVGEATRALLRRWTSEDEKDNRGKIDKLERLLYEAHHRRYLALEPAARLEDAENFLQKFAPQVLEGIYDQAARNELAELSRVVRSCNGSAEKLLDAVDRALLARLAKPKGVGGSGKRSRLDSAQEEQLRLLQALYAVALGKDSLKARAVDLFLPLVEQRLERDKRERGEIDYDDMLAMVWNAIDGPRGEALVKELRARYRYALLDEFQDTDSIQWQIFRRLFVDGGSGNTLYVVGDPKQAIYGFRGADVFTYLQASSELAHKGAKKVALTRNFRSSRDMVDALNAIFDQNAPAPLFRGAIKYDHPVECGKPNLWATSGGKKLVPVTLMRYLPPSQAAGATRPAIGRHIAATIRRLLNEPAHRIEITDEGADARMVEARDIFILTRTNGEADEIGGYLREAGVPFAFYKRNGLFQTNEARDIFDVLRAIEDPNDRSRRFKAWTTPFFAISFRDLTALSELTASAGLALDDPLLRRLYDWNALAERERFAELFSRLLYDSGLVERELLLSDSERELTNYLHIFEVLLEQARVRRLSLAEIVALLEDYIAEKAQPAGADGNVQRLESEREAVQVMTVHLSKGLEADVVFLFGGFNKGPKPNSLEIYHRDGRVRFAFPEQREIEFIKDLLEREEKEENERLLYVGLTRARVKLYLPLLVEGVRRNRIDGYYVALNDRLKEMFPTAQAQTVSEKKLFSVEDVAESGVADAMRSATDKELRAWSPPRDLLDSDAEAKARNEFTLAPRHRPLIIQSYTSLHALGGVAAPNIPVEEFKTDLAATGEGADLPGGRNVGVFLHQVIEKLDMESFRSAPDLNSWKAREDVAELFADGLRRHQVRDPRWKDRGPEIVYNTLNSPIALGPDNSVAALWPLRSAREMEFVCPIPERSHPLLGFDADRLWKAERGYIKGFVDFVFEYRDFLYFADWKSDLLPSYDSAAIERHVAENYSLQAKIYCIGVLRLLRVRTESEYERRFGGLLYVFLRGTRVDGDGRQGLYFHRPRWDEVCRYESDLMTLPQEAVR